MFLGPLILLLSMLHHRKRCIAQAHAGNVGKLAEELGFPVSLAESPASGTLPCVFRVYDKLLPTLRHTMWPKDQQFEFVETQMPNKRGTHGMFQQYQELMRRVKKQGSLGGYQITGGV